jgi:predicted N-acetyltransferase YhbS
LSVRVARDGDWPAIREVQRSAFADDDIVRLVDDGTRLPQGQLHYSAPFRH